MPVDLHIHSTASDGTDPPEVIVALAAAAGLTAIALTDHDNLDGITRARSVARAAAIEVISGVELSVDWAGATMHLLVYHLEPEPGPLQDRLGGLQVARGRRNEQIAERLRALGVDIDYSEVLEEAEGSGAGRPHFAAVMVRKGFVGSIPEAFDRYLARGRPGYVARTRLEAREAIRLARESGAVPVIAHPHTLDLTAEEYTATFAELTADGLGGLEALYAEYSAEMRDHLAGVCDGLGIVATGGSDYHGTYKPQLHLGTGRGDLVVPDEVIEKLEAAR